MYVSTRATSRSVGSSSEVYPDWTEKMRHSYNSFAPRVRLTWTPGQYYYMNGDRKVNLHSKYPSFSVDWERGINGVFKSTGTYERVEVDIQHSIPLGLMRDFISALDGVLLLIKKIYTLWILPILPVPIFPWDGMMKLAVYSSCLTGGGITPPVNISVGI